MEKHLKNCLQVIQTSTVNLATLAKDILDKCKRARAKTIPKAYKKQLQDVYRYSIELLNHFHELEKAIRAERRSDGQN